jgi:MFS family permease
MVCGGVSLKSFVQTIFFFGYMVGSLVFGVLSDKYVYIIVLNIIICVYI